MSLPKEVVREDRALEVTSSQAAEKLMRLRWHWTLDESNADRVSIREYARQVGKAESTVRESAKGYEVMTARPGRAPDEAKTLARMGTETATATEAVAAARRLAPKTAARERPVEVRRVREMARQRAEDRGTSIEEEAPKVAEWVVKSEKATKTQKDERAQALGLRFIEMEGKLTRAKTALIDALNLAHQVPWGDEERELLTSTVANVKALIGLIDLAFAGSADVDWDIELAKLTDGV